MFHCLDNVITLMLKHVLKTITPVHCHRNRHHCHGFPEIFSAAVVIFHGRIHQLSLTISVHFYRETHFLLACLLLYHIYLLLKQSNQQIIIIFTELTPRRTQSICCDVHVVVGNINQGQNPETSILTNRNRLLNRPRNVFDNGRHQKK